MYVLLYVISIAWWIGVEYFRGRGQNHSALTFWLHLTPPISALLVSLVFFAMVLQKKWMRS